MKPEQIFLNWVIVELGGKSYLMGEPMTRQRGLDAPSLVYLPHRDGTNSVYVNKFIASLSNSLVELWEIATPPERILTEEEHLNAYYDHGGD